MFGHARVTTPTWRRPLVGNIERLPHRSKFPSYATALLYRIKESCDHMGKVWKDDKQKYIGGIYPGQGPHITAIPAIFTEVYLTLECIEDM